MSLNLVVAQLLLLSLGLMGIATADPARLPDHAGKVLIALIFTALLSRLRPQAWLRMGTVIWVVTLLLLLLVFFIGVGTDASPDTRRWLPIPGFRFQPSEFAKLGLVLQLASFFSRRGVQKRLLAPALMMLGTAGLVAAQPDVGTTMLIIALGMMLMYAAGVRFTYISTLLLALGIMAMPLGAYYLERHPYIWARFRGHVDQAAERAQGLTQVGMAHRDLTFGGFWGQGPDGLRYDYFAAHTDLIVASVGFSGGLLSVTLLIFAYWLVVSASLQVSELASRIRPMTPQVHGASILSMGAMFMVVGQAIVNLFVAAGVLPVTGVPLPLVSYGFSSMLTMSVAFAVIHSAMREVRRNLPQRGAEGGPAGAVAAD